MSVAGQRQKYYVRIQSIGTARNLYTVFTLETKNYFRADSDTSQWLLLHFKWIVWIRIINILSGRMVLHMMVKRFGCNSGSAVSFIHLINYWFFFVIYRRTYRCFSCHMLSRYQAYSRKVGWQYIEWTYIKKLFRCHGKGDIQESQSYRVQDGIMACMRSTSTTSTASTTLLVLPLHASQVYLRPLSINERSARMVL